MSDGLFAFERDIRSNGGTGNFGKFAGIARNGAGSIATRGPFTRIGSTSVVGVAQMTSSSHDGSREGFHVLWVLSSFLGRVDYAHARITNRVMTVI
jgi:hypothetical protein